MNEKRKHEITLEIADFIGKYDKEVHIDDMMDILGTVLRAFNRIKIKGNLQ